MGQRKQHTLSAAELLWWFRKAEISVQPQGHRRRSGFSADLVGSFLWFRVKLTVGDEPWCWHLIPSTLVRVLSPADKVCAVRPRRPDAATHIHRDHNFSSALNWCWGYKFCQEDYCMQQFLNIKSAFIPTPINLESERFVTTGDNNWL